MKKNANIVSFGIHYLKKRKSYLKLKSNLVHLLVINIFKLYDEHTLLFNIKTAVKFITIKIKFRNNDNNNFKKIILDTLFVNFLPSSY